MKKIKERKCKVILFILQIMIDCPNFTDTREILKKTQLLYQIVIEANAKQFANVSVKSIYLINCKNLMSILLA